MTLAHPVEMFPAEKRCPQCLKTKPLSYFYYKKASPDGHGSWCKACYIVSSRKFMHDYIPYSYITDADPPRTLQESYEKAEHRRMKLSPRR